MGFQGELSTTHGGFSASNCSPYQDGKRGKSSEHEINTYWFVVLTILKNMSQLEGWSHTLWKSKKCSKPPTSIYRCDYIYRGGPHMRSLISIDFPAPKMEPESAHVVSAVSVHWLQCGDCDTARPRQHTTPGQKFFLLTSCSNPVPLDSWQVSYESHGGSRISWFALKEFYFIPTWNTIRHAGHAKWG